MSAGTKRHFNFILLITIIVAFGLVYLSLTRPLPMMVDGQPARPGEISNKEYEQIVKDLKERCPQLRQLVMKLYASGNMITKKELQVFKQQCSAHEMKTRI